MSSIAVEDRSDTQLPYAHLELSSDLSWLAIPRPGRKDTSDTASVAGTVSSGFSERTIRARTVSGDSEENDSADTARASDYVNQLRALIEGGDGTVQPHVRADAEEEEEATLFLPGPSMIGSPGPASQSEMRVSPSKPNLFVDTAAVTPDHFAHFRSATTPSDSATESDNEGRVQRAKSFARPRDEPEQWHIRPEPEQLYEHLDNFFPKIDLDKPIVEGGLSTPTTPATEVPQRIDVFPPPPLHPSRHPPTPTMSPRTSERPTPPPVHPSRSFGLSDREKRKSIRVVVDHKRKTIQRETRNVEVNRDIQAMKQEAKKLDRRKSSSMWGHRIQEVTPSKLLSGQISSAIPESPSDGKPREYLSVHEVL